MANFCGKCGKPLQDGEVCNCTNTTAQATNQQDVTMSNQAEQNVQPMYNEATPTGQPNNTQPNYNQAASNNQQTLNQPIPNAQQNNQTTAGQPSQFSQQMAGAANVAGNYAKNIWKTLVDIWKAPSDNLKEFTDEKNFNHALGFIGAQILLMVILSCLIVRKAYTAIMEAFGGFSYFMSDSIKVPYLKTIFSSLIASAISACIFAVIAMLVLKVFSKVEISFKKAVCLSSIYSAASLPFLVLSIVFSLFSLPLAILALTIGGILGYFYVHTALDDGSITDQNKRVYTSFLIFALYVIVSVLLLYIYVKMQ